jgi:hypothetical protein
MRGTRVYRKLLGQVQDLIETKPRKHKHKQDFWGMVSRTQRALDKARKENPFKDVGVVVLTMIKAAAMALALTTAYIASSVVAHADDATVIDDAGSTVGIDVASTASPPYESEFASLPSLPPLTLGLNDPGVADIFDNVTGVLPWDYAFGASLGNEGNLGIQAWDPSNPYFDVVAESVGTTSYPWPGVATLIGVETPLGGFTNTESYANTYDPTNTTCIICDTFTLLGPDNSNLFSFTTDIPIGATPEFEVTTPWGDIGPDLGNAFDYSSLANGLVG